MLRDDIAQVNRQDIGNGDLVGFAATGSGGSLVFVGEIDGEGTFGPVNIVCRAARALLICSVPDDPDRRVFPFFVASGATQVEPRPLASIRHCSLMTLMCASVV
jgi:hypothetical protein